MAIKINILIPEYTLYDERRVPAAIQTMVVLARCQSRPPSDRHPYDYSDPMTRSIDSRKSCCCDPGVRTSDLAHCLGAKTIGSFSDPE